MISTFPQVVDLGEYAAFYFAEVIAEKEYRGVPTPYKAAWLHALKELAYEFAQKAAHRAEKQFFVDSTPWNMRIIANLTQKFPDAVFVVVLRHYRGVVQSLTRSHFHGWRWCGRTVEERAALWAEMYGHCDELPSDRTVALGFDRLCDAPEQTIQSFFAALEEKGVSSQFHELAVLAHSHATVTPRETVARLEHEERVVFQGRSSVDARDWSEDSECRVWPIIRKVNKSLAARFSEDYITPDDRS